MASSVIQGTSGDASEIPSVWNQPPLSRAERRTDLNQRFLAEMAAADVKVTARSRGKRPKDLHGAVLSKYIPRWNEVSLIQLAGALVEDEPGVMVPLYDNLDQLFAAFNKCLTETSGKFQLVKVAPYYGILGKLKIPKIRITVWVDKRQYA